MRVLLTNNTLAARAGSELYVRDVAVELMRRGHHPVAYSTNLGAVAEELRAATIPVIDRLESLGEAPDIIHGQHHYETLSALLKFPATPALYYCHGWLPWEEATLKHPNILYYVAVDELCRERLIAEGGIDAKRIEVIFNFFDGRLFPRRPPLPPKPKLALLFNNGFTEGAGLNIFKEACARSGIELHVCGLGQGNPTDQPGALLAAYDIVLAKGRSAIEALAVGAAVVLCSGARLGPMVTTGNFWSLRQFNFGIRTLAQPLDVNLLTAELGKYDSTDAAMVSRFTRDACELQPAVDRILDLYQRVLAAAQHLPEDRSRAGAFAAEYLERWSPVYKTHFDMMVDRDRWTERCLVAEQALAERGRQLVETSSAAESALARQERLLQDAEQQAGHIRALLSGSDAEVTRLSRELAAVRSSATWQWTQGLLHSLPVQLLFGGLIRSVARRQLTPEPPPASAERDPSPGIPSVTPSTLPEPEPPAPLFGDVQRSADRMIAEQGFLGVPRETFSQAGREQLIALLQEGMRPESKVLEFGCGCLRIAYWLVRFLDPGRYHGIEPARLRIDCGLRYLFTPEEIALKRPCFDYNTDFNSSVFGTKFDFFLARSIWTHAAKPQIEATLDCFLRDAAPAAVFLASYLPSASPDDDYQGLQWVGTSHESGAPGVIRHSLAWIFGQCRERDLSCEEIPGLDCDSQLWLRIRRSSGRPPLDTTKVLAP